MTKIEEIVKNSSGETREVLEYLVSNLAKSLQEINKLKQHVDYIKHDNQLLRKKLFGSSSEKTKPDELKHQPEFFNEFELCSQALDLEEQDTADSDNVKPSKTAQKKPGRKPLPKNLPRKIVEHDLSEADKQCVCGCQMDCIGVEVSEQLEYRPAQFNVIEHRSKKYGCSACNTANKKNPLIPAQLKTAAKPAQLIPKSIASPLLLAMIIIKKFFNFFHFWIII